MITVENFACKGDNNPESALTSDFISEQQD